MRYSLLALGILTLTFVLVGCKSNTAATASHFYYVDADDAKAAEKGESFEDPSKVAPKGATKIELAKLSKARDVAEAAMKAHPTAETKKKYVDITVDLADKTMYSPELDRHAKYGTALKLFRAALVVDPNNTYAKQAAQTIVEIYNQMGRPVPS